jgi:uncharacterized membrane protein
MLKSESYSPFITFAHYDLTQRAAINLLFNSSLKTVDLEWLTRTTAFSNLNTNLTFRNP